MASLCNRLYSGRRCGAEMRCGHRGTFLQLLLNGFSCLEASRTNLRVLSARSTVHPPQNSSLPFPLFSPSRLPPPSTSVSASLPRCALASAPPSSHPAISNPPSLSSRPCATTSPSLTPSSSSATWTCHAPSDPCCWQRQCQPGAMMAAALLGSAVQRG